MEKFKIVKPTHRQSYEENALIDIIVDNIVGDDILHVLSPTADSLRRASRGDVINCVGNGVVGVQP